MTAPTVLLVDDEHDLREVAEDILRDEGFEVFSASTGDAGFEVYKAEDPDLVISDVRMPGGDGISLLARIREHDPNASVVMMTGYTDVSEQTIMDLGATAILRKPIGLDHLVEAVRRFSGNG